MYYCPVCEKDVADSEAVAPPLMDGWLCPTCGEELVESYECPIHGTDAPDGYANCAKC